MLTWNLHVDLNFIFKVVCSTFIVSKFSPKFYSKTLCPDIFFPMFPAKFILFYFPSFFLQNLSYEFLFPANLLYRSSIFGHICVRSFGSSRPRLNHSIELESTHTLITRASYLHSCSILGF